VDATVSRRRTPSGRVEGGEEGVLDEHARAGEPVEQRRLARVGVAGNHDRGDLVALALGALGLPGALHRLQLAAELGNLGVDPAPVGLDLGLTGATATDALTASDPATGLARQAATPAAEPLLHVL